MNELAFFEKIAPFLKDPLVLSGFVVFLIIILFKTIIKSGIIPTLTKKSGGDLARKAISFSVIISILVIVLGFSLELFKLYKNSEPFDYTIFLENNAGETVLKSNGKLVLRIENDKREEPIDDKGSANFKQIPPKLINQTVNLQMEVEGWQFKNGKTSVEIILEGKSTIIIVEPDNSLRFISGSVRDEESNFLSDVRVSIGDVFTKTDENGRFLIEIPPENQKPKQTLITNKSNYLIWAANVYPATKQEVKIILQKK